MKKLIAIVFIILGSLPAFSQINFGLKAGVSTTSLSMPTFKTITSGTTSFTVDNINSAKYGFHGGVFMRVTLFGFYIQPELLFSTRTDSYTITNLQTTTAAITNQNFNKLDIPVMVGFKFGPLRINAGPSGSLLINSPKSLISNPYFKNNFSRMTYGYQAGLGFDLFKLFTFDLRYEGSLQKYQNQIQNLVGTKYNLDDRPNAFLISVGLMF
jgi:Outer membrane protein beta-barrel domain